MSQIADNIRSTRKQIDEAAAKSGRKTEEIALIAVSKTKPVSMLEDAYACGMRDFGENKVQELCEKEAILPKDIRWHMIGHLQRNKVKDIVGKVYLIHSVDSVRLAEAISKEAVKKGCIVNILLEINIASEESKFGFKPDEVMNAAEQLAHLEGICIRGLMTVAPQVDQPEENRMHFRKMKQLSVDIANKNIDNVYMEYLSMGMTGDYMVAVEEGASFVRVGTGIFGQRDYSHSV